MKFYPEIVISGHDFSPNFIFDEMNIILEDSHEKDDYNKRLKSVYGDGYGILRTQRQDISAESISEVLENYKHLRENESIKKTIDDSYFNLLIDPVYEKVSVNSKYLIAICKVFPEISITFVSDEVITNT